MDIADDGRNGGEGGGNSINMNIPFFRLSDSDDFWADTGFWFATSILSWLKESRGEPASIRSENRTHLCTDFL